VPTRTASLVRVQVNDALAAGEYKLRVVWRTMYRTLANPTQHYTISDQKVGELGFTVYKEGAKVKAALATLAEKELQKSPLTEAELQQKYQRPVDVKETAIPRSKDIFLRTHVVGAGTFDIQGWKKEIPQFKSATPADPLYASLFGPELNTGETMRLREIVWKEQTVTLRVDIFTDRDGRWGNLRSHPLLIVPLQPPKEKADKTVAGEYVVDVEWTTLSAPALGQPYTPGKTTTSRAKFKVE
jgi:hypothetical protein